MKIWLIKLEEPVPIDPDYRPYRMAMLMDALAREGHEVLRWCSDRNHSTGKNRIGRTKKIRLDSLREFFFLNSGIKFKSAVSFLRYFDNIVVSRKLYKAALRQSPPDVIVCAMPTPRMARISAALSKAFRVPLIIDARDYWPDVIAQELQGLRAVLAKPVMALMRRDLRIACHQAKALVGITPFYLRHLLRYSGRGREKHDIVLPLGFDADTEKLSQEEIGNAKRFWESFGIFSPNVHSIVYFAGKLSHTIFRALDPVIIAAEILLRRGYHVIFVLAGSGQYAAEIRKKTKEIPNICLPGRISPKNLAYLRANSLAALLPVERRPDYQNSLSNKFFEYLSSGLPVLSFLDGLPEKTIVEAHCGFKYDTGEELSERIGQLIGDEQLRSQMSRNAHELFDRQFKAIDIYRQYAQLVFDVASINQIETVQ